MAMLTVICNDCGEEYSLRGWCEKDDLKDTPWENKMDTITDEELYKLQEEGKIKDEWDKFLENPICEECGSKNVRWF